MEGIAVNNPHLDYFYGPAVGPLSREGNSYRMTLGVWRPVNMQNPVCDYPLALLDASTFQPDPSAVLYRGTCSDLTVDPCDDVHLGDGYKGCAVTSYYQHNDAHRWYFYSGQTANELLVWRHQTAGQLQRGVFANVHCSFRQGKCPEGHSTRTSIEARVDIYW